MLPGVKIPAPGSMEEFFPGYDEKFSVAGDQLPTYNRLFQARLTSRIEWMEKNGIDAKFIDSLRQLHVTVKT